MQRALILAVSGLVGPRIWDALSVPGGPLARAKRKWDTWRGIAQFKDKRIKAVVDNMGPPAKDKTKARH